MADGCLKKIRKKGTLPLAARMAFRMENLGKFFKNFVCAGKILFCKKINYAILFDSRSSNNSGVQIVCKQFCFTKR